jgi:hypothetical protein
MKRVERGMKSELVEGGPLSNTALINERKKEN